MPNEPNNRMDEMLKACAQKRQAEAGPPFELHPAARRLLQAEVARTFPKNAPETKTKSSWLGVFWVRLAWGSCVVAALALGAFVILQNRPQPRPAFQLAKDASSKSFSRYGLAPGAPGPSNRPISSRTLVRSSGAVTSPAVQESMNQIAADKQKITALQVPSGGSGFGGAAIQARQRFVQVATPYRRDLNSPAQPNVLNSFHIEQVGGQIRVVDADESVYEPQPAADLAIVLEPKVDALKSQNAPQDNGLLMKAQSAAVSAALPSGDQVLNLFFRVAGTNRTLNQKVVFEGNYSVQTNRSNVQVPALAGTASPTRENKTQMQIQFPNARIQGQAIIGGSNKFEVNAIPVRP